MELAVIDSFVRPESSKGGTRNGEEPAVPFSDVLEASSRRSEPAARSRQNESRPETADKSPAQADQVKPRADQPKARADAAAEARPKAKSESRNDANRDTAASAAAESTQPQDPANAPVAAEAAPDTAVEVAAPGRGAAALDVIAELLAAGSSVVDPATPQGQLVAAVVVPQNVPEHAAAAANHTQPGLAGAPAVPTPAPGNQPAATPDAPQPGSAPAQPSPAAQPSAPFTVPTGTAAPQTDAVQPMAAANPTPVATSPAPAAPQTDPVASASTTPIPADALAAEIADDLGPLPMADTPAEKLGITTSAAGTGNAAANSTARTPGQDSVSGYVAQMVSQEAGVEDAALQPAAPLAADGDPVSGFTIGQDDADALVTAAEGDGVAALGKAAEGTAVHVSDSAPEREVASVEAVAARHARAAAVPVAEQVVVRIAKAIADGVDRINVKLSPAELGQIDIRMEIGPDGRFQAVFSADRPQTVELLQRDARELARALQDAGLRADTGSLSFNLRGQGQHGQGDGAPGHGPSLPPGLAGLDLPADSTPPPVYRPGGSAAGRVDIRV